MEENRILLEQLNGQAEKTKRSRQAKGINKKYPLFNFLIFLEDENESLKGQINQGKKILGEKDALTKNLLKELEEKKALLRKNSFLTLI